MRFEGKVAVVLGGNSGMGLASAIAFAQEGAKVAITGRNEETLASAAEQIGPGTLAVRSNISDVAATAAFFAKVADRFGKIDALFINSGVGAFLPLEQVTEEDWDRIVSINLKGPYFAVQKAVPHMSGDSAIVINSSIAWAKGLPHNSVYAATKGGIRALVRNFGVELVDRGIRVTSISPGPIDTPIITRTQGLPLEEVEATKEIMISAVPMRRMGRPEEAAKTVLFLASSDASFITGIDMFVDGGLASF